jgi:hypothetical protein
MIDILKKIGLFSLVVSGLVLLGNGINAVINWSWLVTICGIFRVMIDPLDFFIDTTELISSIANFLSVLIVFWGARGFILVTNYFKNK